MNIPAFDLCLIDIDQTVENQAERVGLNTALAKDVGFTGWDIQFQSAYSRAILSAVVLFFHEEKQLIETPQRGFVFLLIIRERLFQANEGNTALMSDGIAHSGKQ